MLVVRFQMGGSPYALPVRHVLEVVPRAELRPLPLAPAWAAGLLMYRRTVVPVVDLSAFVGGEAHHAFSTRIIILRASHGATALGLLADRVTDVENVTDAMMQTLPMVVNDAPWLGRVYTCSFTGQMVCLVEPDTLLPAEVRQSLAQAAGVA